MFPSTPQHKNSFHLVSLPHAIWLAVGTTLASSLQGAHAYSWNLRSDAKQCRNATVVLNGSGGKPPYKLLMIPYGASPLKVEARRIVEQVFTTGDQTSGEIMVNYPADSQFVALVSDASGFGTGGTSVATQVGDSDDSSCFDATKDVSPAFVFNIEPANQFVQCQSMRIWWDPATVQGNPTFQAVIPGGQSLTIPQGDHSRVPNQGIGFNWVPNVKTGTTVLLVGGDDRGIGTAGSGFYVVGGGTLNDASCLGSNPPSSTAGTPAGVTLPTGGGNHAGGGGGGGGGGSDTGAIVGGVVGGVAFITCLILILFWYRRRHGHRKRAKERPVDLLHDDEDSEDDHRRNAQPQTQQQLDYYTPEPFLVPDPTLHSDGTSATDVGGGFGTSSDGRPLSGTSFTRSDTQDLLGGGSAYGLGGYGWAGGSTTTNNSRKGAMRLRPVNIVQHEDAGPPPPPPSNGAGEEESETIELPPAYTAVQKRVVDAAEGSQPSVGGGSSTASAPIATPATAMTATHPDTTAATTSTGNATTPGVESGRQ